MSTTLPDEVPQAAPMSGAELPQVLDALVFQRARLTVADATGLAGTDRLRSQHMASSRGTSLYHDVADVEEDLEALREVGRSRSFQAMVHR